jgi:hypothetical protein
MFPHKRITDDIKISALPSPHACKMAFHLRRQWKSIFSSLLYTFPEAEFLDEIQAKVVLHAVHSHLYSVALRLLFLQTHATSYSF